MKTATGMGAAMAILEEGDVFEEKGRWGFVPGDVEYRALWSCPECGMWWALLGNAVGRDGTISHGLRCLNCTWADAATFKGWPV